MNTLVSYLYRDADNYKNWNEAVVAGEITEDMEKTILSCLYEGEWFIPSQVGLPEVRFEDSPTEADHCYFELDESGFTSLKEGEGDEDVCITAEELVKSFLAAKDNWNDSLYPLGDASNAA